MREQGWRNPAEQLYKGGADSYSSNISSSKSQARNAGMKLENLLMRKSVRLFNFNSSNNITDYASIKWPDVKNQGHCEPVCHSCNPKVSYKGWKKEGMAFYVQKVQKRSTSA